MAILSIILVCAIGIVLLPYWLIKTNPFPQPSGQWQVGVSDFIWDAPDRTGIIAKVWYPIASSNTTTESPLYQKINMNKVFAAGHSVGGAASFVACGKDDRIAKGVNLDGIFVDPANTNYTNKELLLISSNWEKYSPKDKTSRSRIKTIRAKDKVQREQLALKANLHQCSFQSASHFNFMDLPLIIRSTIGKKIGLFGSIDELELLSKTSAEMKKFFNE